MQYDSLKEKVRVYPSNTTHIHTQKETRGNPDTRTLTERKFLNYTNRKLTHDDNRKKMIFTSGGIAFNITFPLNVLIQRIIYATNVL